MLSKAPFLVRGADGEMVAGHLKIHYLNAKELLLGSHRFDLPFKFALVEAWDRNQDSARETEAYLESIRAFNGFFEERPRKTSGEQFLESFFSLYLSIKKYGYLESAGPILCTPALEPMTGAHRISICAYFGFDVPVVIQKGEVHWDQHFFESRGLARSVSRFGAEILCRLHPDSKMLFLYGAVPWRLRDSVCAEVSDRQRVLYSERRHLGLKALANLKRLQYKDEPWTGSPSDRFRALRGHARRSYGVAKTSIFVLRERDEKDLVRTKQSIRKRIGRGNYPAHSTDSYEEVLRISHILFHPESDTLLKSISLKWPNEETSSTLSRFTDTLARAGRPKSDFLVTGGAVLSLLGLRKATDLDVIVRGNDVFPDENAGTSGVDNHRGELGFYPGTEKELFENKSMSFEFDSYRFVSPKTLLAMKVCRAEFPKDFIDVALLRVASKVLPNLLTIFILRKLQIVVIGIKKNLFLWVKRR